MITFKDVIHRVDFELVWKEYLIFYPDMLNLRGEYFQIYTFLLNREPEYNHEGMVVHIDRQDYEDFKDEVDCQLELDRKEVQNVGYRVHGKNNSTEWNGYWDISAESWGKWLGYYIHDNVVKFLSIERIAALCFYEMTWHGLSESEVINWFKNLRINSEK